MTSIDVRELRKSYGRKVAVDGLSFTVEPGRVTGFVGPNGAGKSTTMRMILGLAAPDQGTAHVGGRPYRALRTPLCQVGALLDASAVHPGRRARDHLLWMAQSNGLASARVDEVLEVVGLASVARQRAGGFSLGMRQRLGIAGALLGDAPVLLFDEPVTGLDPEGIHWIRGLLRDLAAQGRTVFVASHLMSELEDTADHLVVLARGRLVADASVADLIARASGEKVVLHCAEPVEATAALAAAGASAAVTGQHSITVERLPAERIADVLAGAGLTFSGLAPYRVSLETAYLDLTRDSAEFAAPAAKEQ